MVNLNNINTLINDRRRDTTSNSIDMTAEGFRAENSTLNEWNRLHDWEWQIEDTIINYNEGITVYSAPSGFKAPIDLTKHKPPKTKEFDRVSETAFESSTLTTNRFAIQTIGQTDYLRIKTSGDWAQITTLSSTASTTTTVAGAMSALGVDSYESYSVGASLKFDYSGTSGTMTIDLGSAIDLSRFQGRSGIYWDTNFSAYTNWSNITLRLGSSSTNYWTAAVTTDHLSRTPTGGQWNRHGFQWTSLTKVGSPGIAAIDYIQIGVNFSVDPALTDCRIENLFIAENVPLKFEYYSNNMVVAVSSSAKTQTFSSATATNDQPLWSGKWDWVNEAYVNSTLENIFWMTGEYNDLAVAQNKIAQIVEPLKRVLPSRRRYPETVMKFDIN